MTDWKKTMAISAEVISIEDEDSDMTMPSMSVEVDMALDAVIVMPDIVVDVVIVIPDMSILYVVTGRSFLFTGIVSGQRSK